MGGSLLLASSSSHACSSSRSLPLSALRISRSHSCSGRASDARLFLAGRKHRCPKGFRRAASCVRTVMAFGDDNFLLSSRCSTSPHVPCISRSCYSPAPWTTVGLKLRPCFSSSAAALHSCPSLLAPRLVILGHGPSFCSLCPGCDGASFSLTTALFFLISYHHGSFYSSRRTPFSSASFNKTRPNRAVPDSPDFGVRRKFMPEASIRSSSSGPSVKSRRTLWPCCCGR